MSQNGSVQLISSSLASGCVRRFSPLKLQIDNEDQYRLINKSQFVSSQIQLHERGIDREGAIHQSSISVNVKAQVVGARRNDGIGLVSHSSRDYI